MFISAISNEKLICLDQNSTDVYDFIVSYVTCNIFI